MKTQELTLAAVRKITEILDSPELGEAISSRGKFAVLVKPNKQGDKITISYKAQIGNRALGEAWTFSENGASPADESA